MILASDHTGLFVEFLRQNKAEKDHLNCNLVTDSKVSATCLRRHLAVEIGNSFCLQA